MLRTLKYNTLEYVYNTLCLRKKKPKRFFVISPIKLGRFWWNLVYRFLNNLLQNDVNVSHFTWIMSLHYLVKLEMLIRTCYRWVVTERNSRIYLTLTVAFKFSRFKSVDNSMWTCCERSCTKTHHCSGAINDATDEWLPQWRHEPSLGLIALLCSQSLFQFVQVSDTCLVHIHLQ